MWGRISRDSSGRGALWEQRSSHRAKRVNWVFQGVWLAETRDPLGSKVLIGCKKSQELTASCLNMVGVKIARNEDQGWVC